MSPMSPMSGARSVPGDTAKPLPSHHWASEGERSSEAPANQVRYTTNQQRQMDWAKACRGQ
jgi:hypothetical protein